MKRKGAKRTPKSEGGAAADARRRLRGALATGTRPAAGSMPAKKALPRVVVRAQRRLEDAREKAKAAARDVEHAAYEGLSVVVKALKIPMHDAAALLGYAYVLLELLDDGRWKAEIPALPEVVIHAKTREEALANVEAQALRAVADEIERAELAPPGVLFPFERGLFRRIEHEKQASRDADARDLASGRKTAEQLQQENAIFHGVRVRVDHKKVKHPR